MNTAAKLGQGGATDAFGEGAGADRRRVVRITSPAGQRRRAPAAAAPLPRSAHEEVSVTSVSVDPVSASPGPKPTVGSAMLEELRATGFIGMWKDREDIKDSTAFVQHLREQIQIRADRAAPDE